MARLRDTQSVEGDDHSTVLRDSSNPPTRTAASRQTSNASASPSPSAASDKENESSAASKGAMGPPPLPSAQTRNPHASKRRRVDDGQHDRSRSSTLEPEHRVYDPNQDVEERRMVRKGLRDLNKEAADLRNEWLQPDSTGLEDAVKRANTLFGSVKQTSDATIDSRLLVTAGDLAFKKTQQVSIGDGSQGIDVDDFVSKCITFMRRGERENVAQSNNHRRRRIAATGMDSDEDNEEPEGGQEVGDAFNWAHLGSHASFPSNSRPPVPGFLLGPLSVQKRARAQTQRRQRLRADPNAAVRPQEVLPSDIEQSENSSIRAACQKIHTRLKAIQRNGEASVEAEADESVDETQFEQLCEKYNITDDGGVPLFKFAVNPRSFGQTVENLFYVSFLIKEGAVGVQNDSKGMPSLHLTQQGEARRAGRRHQAVFSIDFETWQDLVEIFKLEESLIEHRAEENVPVLGANGWYG